MIYSENSPHPLLSNYIDAYWSMTGDGCEDKIEKILPDGCVDIIFNFGSECKTDNASFTLRNEKIYLVGTMTKYKETFMTPDTKLLGIRFKPAAFSVFYKHDALYEVTDQTIELEKKFSPDLKETLYNSTTYLNQFFINKITKPNHTLLAVVQDFQTHKGQIGLTTLSENHYTTVRQLERKFRQYMGISPKEFINLVRYQNALSIIKNKATKRSLLDVAIECGYYDHAHLTNEVKRFTGLLPSQI